MKTRKYEHLKLRLSTSRWGRILLHLGTCLRRGANVRWHLRCILREFRRDRDHKADVP